MIADTTEAIRLDRRLGAAYVVRGAAYGNTGETVKAIDDFENALRLNPNDKWAHRNLEIARQKKKRGR